MDYASFVGAYKPTMDDNKNIVYKFVPQIFLNAYVKAWEEYNNNKSNPKPVYLIIEEINRGNCAAIFGDLFQLLDRADKEDEYKYKNNQNKADKDKIKEGMSKYDITPNEDIVKYLEGKVNNSKMLRLPPNLCILATMNTNDQSLFPMDSAFKRRWDWEYVPINYSEKDSEGNENKSYEYKIKIGNYTYKWIDFLKNINEKILDITKSADKQIGNFFVKPDDKQNNIISDDKFINKVMFYLWEEVFKEEYGSFRHKGDKEFTFEKMFTTKTEGKKLLKEFLDTYPKK